MVAQVGQKTLAAYLGRFSVLLAGRVLGALALFAVNILIVNHFGPEALANYAVFTSLVSVLAICLFLGFNSVAAIFASEYQTTGNRDLLKGFAISAIRNGALASLLLILGLAAIWIFSADLVTTGTLAFSAIVLLTASGTAALGLNGAIQVGLKRPAMGQLPETLLRPVIMLTGTAALLAGQLIADVSAVYGMACIAVWLALLAIFIIDADFLRGYRKVPSRTDTARWHRAALPWMGTSLLWDYMIDLVVLIASMLAGSVELAILHVAFRYRVLAGFGMRTIHALFMPEITENSTNNNIPAVRRKIRHTNLASLGYTICVLAGFAVLGNWLFQLFSLEASRGLPVLLVISATMLIRAVFGPAPLILAVNNSHLATLAVSFAGFVLAALWLWVFYPFHGIMAAAVAYSGANLLVSAILWLYAWHRTGINCSIFAAMR